MAALKKTWYIKNIVSLVIVFQEGDKGNVSKCVRDFLVILETEIMWLEIQSQQDRLIWRKIIIL